MEVHDPINQQKKPDPICAESWMQRDITVKDVQQYLELGSVQAFIIG